MFRVVTDDPDEQIITVKCEPEHTRAPQRGSPERRPYEPLLPQPAGRSRSQPRSSADRSRTTGGHPATSTGFHSKAGAAATFAASETAIPNRKAVHTAPRARRVRSPDGFNNPAVASSSNPSTDRGHNEALTASAPPGWRTPAGVRTRHTRPPPPQPARTADGSTRRGQTRAWRRCSPTARRRRSSSPPPSPRIECTTRAHFRGNSRELAGRSRKPPDALIGLGQAKEPGQSANCRHMAPYKL